LSDWSKLLSIRRALLATLRIVALNAFAGIALLHFADAAAAQNSSAALLSKPVSLPDMALGPAKAPITIVEYSSMTCPHCADFEENVFPMLQSKYIDTGKVRFVSREFPLDIKAAAASMLARCAANGDGPKYFEATTMLFKQQGPLMERTTDTLKAVGGRFGLNDQAVEACVKDQALLDKLSADQRFALDELKVDATPTFFINGERLKGSMSFEEFEAKLSPHLKH
jgi:protein-disulfide isomerase